jgi:hydroxymethylpyrimidine kinase/phosphomethylpyrimidine kinase/thiamine-phosphate diphosphorylase
MTICPEANRAETVSPEAICALTVAGSDPSGGAGVQADLRTFEALGVAGLSAITALTVQSSQGVAAVHPVPAEALFDQIAAILDDCPAGAVKIGMLGGKAQVDAVAEALGRFRPPNVVLDPVLASTGGVPLLDDAGRAVLLDKLVPLCDLVTPNLDECRELTGVGVCDAASAAEAGKRLQGAGARCVLVKGGHLAQEPTDFLIDADGTCHVLTAFRIDTPHTHGTGCFLSSAIAAHLARGWGLRDAVTRSKEQLSRALAHPIIVGRGRGYPSILAALQSGSATRTRSHSERIALLEGLYVLTGPDLRPDRDSVDVVQAALDGGARIVQLRDKQPLTPALLELARRLSAMARKHGALFIVNDRVDIALAASADGVHLGPDDMPPADARRILGPDAIVGVSVSTVAEAVSVAPHASYLGVGAIFGTTTKADAGPPVGVERIAEIRAAFPKHPIVAIGGIDERNIAAVAQAGACAAAVVSAVVCAPDMRQATEDLERRFRQARTAAP